LVIKFLQQHPSYRPKVATLGAKNMNLAMFKKYLNLSWLPFLLPIPRSKHFKLSLILTIFIFSQYELFSIGKRELLQQLKSCRHSNYQLLCSEEILPIQKVIRYVNFSNNDLHKRDRLDWLMIKNAISILENLTSLDLSSNELPQFSINNILNAMNALESCKNLKHLNLSFNHLNSLSTEAYLALENLLEKLLELRKLDVSNNNLGFLESLCFSEIGRIFSQCKKVEHLCLANNRLSKIRNLNWLKFVTEIHKLENIKTLDLRNNLLRADQEKILNDHDFYPKNEIWHKVQQQN
jgi:Leucine-rich repeat (LRR) protein